LARPYSPLRNGHSKWQLSSFCCDSPPNIELETDQGEKVVKITRQDTVERYTLSSLLQRSSIKNSSHLNSALVDFWRVLNPFHLKAISGQLWLSLNKFLYCTCSPKPMISQAEVCAKHDTDLDLLHKTGVSFEVFKESLFEMLDATTKSKLANEYTRLLKSQSEALGEQLWFKKTSLHSKLHMKTRHTKCFVLPQIQTSSSKMNFFLTEATSPRTTRRTSHGRSRQFSGTARVKMTLQSPRGISHPVSSAERTLQASALMSGPLDMLHPHPRSSALFSHRLLERSNPSEVSQEVVSKKSQQLLDIIRHK
jgi:hypothetical protein